MTTSESQERDRDVEALGEQMGPVFHVLNNDFYWLQSKWQEYLELYGTREHVDLLNSAAPSFFYVLDGVFWEDILLHLSRLTDPETTGQGRSAKRNLTFKALPPLCDDQSFRDELEDLVTAAVEATAFARDWRNRRLAHRDLDLTMGRAAKPLASASRRQVDRALNALHEVLRAVYRHYFDSDIQREVALSGQGAESLLSVLQSGVDAERARLKDLFGDG